MTESFQVVIVGGGPVGVALAVELGQRNISCALIERHLEPQPIPKGQNLTNRSLEHFYFWNCADELRAARLMPTGYAVDGVTAYGNLMSPYWYVNQAVTPGRGEHVRQFYFQSNERLPQYRTEAVLRERLKQLPSVSAFFGWQARSVEQHEGGVRVSIATIDGGEGPFYSWSADAQQQAKRQAGSDQALSIEAEYVVGCDGGRSLVRETMGIDRAGRNFDQRMVLAVFRSREFHEALGRFPDATTFRVLKPQLKGYWQFFGRVDVGESFFFHAPVPLGTRADNYDFHALLEEAAGFPFAAEFDYVGFWDLRIMVASTYQQGRIFLAGDSAHQHPPYGGFGLNTGLEDAANLGWKLAARLQGWGGEALLDSYTEERRPIFVETGHEMIEGWIERDREWLETNDPAKDKAGFEMAWQQHRLASSGRVQFYEPHYEGSSVVEGLAGAACSIHGSHSLQAQPGHHLAPRRLSTGKNVYEELGAGFTLLAFGAEDADVGAIRQAATAANLPFKVILDDLGGERTELSSRLILVRPDQYVVWSGDVAPRDTVSLMRKVSGAQ
jgi:2-polyprenyl-6-methoxyphenol hydroxylase-like FAD-dependent oxidoreductase